MSDLVERLRGAYPNTIAQHEAADEIERLRGALRYEENRFNRIGTHADACWSWGPSHYECALREIERLRDALNKANEQAERFEREWYLRGDALERAADVARNACEGWNDALMHEAARIASDAVRELLTGETA